MKKILCIILGILFLLPCVNAISDFSNFKYMFIYHADYNTSVLNDSSGNNYVLSNVSASFIPSFNSNFKQAFNTSSLPSYLTRASLPSLGLGNHSVSFWQNQSDYSNSGAIFGQDGGTSLYDRSSFYSSSNKTLTFWVNRAGTVYWYPFDYYGTTGQYLPLNNWAMITITYNTTTARFYVNGTFIGENSSSISQGAVGNGVFLVGGWRVGYNYFRGSIDELAYFNGTVLTDTEISQLYQCGLEGYTTERCGLALTNLSIINSTYDMTSDGSCKNWNATNYNYCETTDGTPTVTFSTNLNANCSLRNVLTNYNITGKCSTTGTQIHSCTIINAEKLVFGPQNIYASCFGFDNNATNPEQQNISSLALPINMTAGSPYNPFCVKILGTGCGVSIANNCMMVTRLI